MKSFDEFKKHCSDLPEFSTEFIAKEFSKAVEDAKTEGNGQNVATILGLTSSIFSVVTRQMEAYHNWLVNQLDESRG